MNLDRTVHATDTVFDVVRYDRAGKWYIESRLTDKRRSVTLAEAVEYALGLYEHGGTIIYGQPGGRAFDSAVHRGQMTTQTKPLDRDVEVPRRCPGQWLDSSNKERTYVGCGVCGWEEHGPYGDVRQKWLDHTHDPIEDIRHRHLQGCVMALDYFIDVGYLLDLIDRGTSSRD